MTYLYIYYVKFQKRKNTKTVEFLRSITNRQSNDHRRSCYKKKTT